MCDYEERIHEIVRKCSKSFKGSWNTPKVFRNHPIKIFVTQCEKDGNSKKDPEIVRSTLQLFKVIQSTQSFNETLKTGKRFRSLPKIYEVDYQFTRH